MSICVKYYKLAHITRSNCAFCETSVDFATRQKHICREIRNAAWKIKILSEIAKTLYRSKLLQKLANLQNSQQDCGIQNQMLKHRHRKSELLRKPQM